MLSAVLVIALVVSLPAQRLAVPVTVVGSFANVKSDGEHASGYDVELWSMTDNHIVGLVSYHRGLAGDPPTGEIEHVKFNPATGALQFNARITTGLHTCSVHDSVPSHDLVTFRGFLRPGQLQGDMILEDRTDSPSFIKDRADKIVLQKDTSWSAEMRDYPDYDAWRRDQEQILKRLGPKW